MMKLKIPPHRAGVNLYNTSKGGAVVRLDQKPEPQRPDPDFRVDPFGAHLNSQSIA
jgi:hypothetical protein